MAGAVFSLLPFLVFSDHLSETYQYLPAAFFGLMISFALASLLRQGMAFRVSMGLLILLAAYGSWLRTDRVKQSAGIADRILQETTERVPPPIRAKLWFAIAPGTPQSSQMGIYGLTGLNTIDMQQEGFLTIQSALRLRLNDPDIEAIGVSFNELKAKCASPPDFCLVVSEDGQVSPFVP